jgi:hypothetical protein
MGGTHDPERVLPLCSAHHRAVHDGRLVVTGTSSQGLHFTHADGSVYGAPQHDPNRSKILSEVFQMLVSMGFRQREARQMLDASGPHVGVGVGVEEALRTVLQQAKVSCMAERVEAYGGMGAWLGLGALGYSSTAAVPARPYC